MQTTSLLRPPLPPPLFRRRRVNHNHRLALSVCESDPYLVSVSLHMLMHFCELLMNDAIEPGGVSSIMLENSIADVILVAVL